MCTIMTSSSISIIKAKLFVNLILNILNKPSLFWRVPPNSLIPFYKFVSAKIQNSNLSTPTTNRSSTWSKTTSAWTPPWHNAITHTTMTAPTTITYRSWLTLLKKDSFVWRRFSIPIYTHFRNSLMGLLNVTLSESEIICRRNRMRGKEKECTNLSWRILNMASGQLNNI